MKRNIINKSLKGIIFGMAMLCFSACGVMKKNDSLFGKDEIDPEKYKDIPVQQMKEEDGISYAFRTSGKKFEIYNGVDFEEFFSVGVNVGSGQPNNFPGEMNIGKKEYLEWFEYIADMNANTIRVYTVLSPDFYDAFYEYNLTHEKKLYLFQGCWYDEDILKENDSDVYSVRKIVKKDLVDLVNIFHGKADIAEETGHASGVYTKDISNYVAGWILGIEPDTDMVENTAKNHPDCTGYSGDYLSCENVQAYEAFWCEIGDYVLAYEDKIYHTQRMVSFVNWPTADVLKHPNEPLRESEDAVSLNVENIHVGEKFKAGLFASYHIYSYYPNFLFEEENYKKYVDDEGNPNTYRAYLEDLIKVHERPVLVAEFGLPVSRGVTHVNPVTGFNQGGLNEKQQGEMLVSMLKDIKAAGYAGGLIFSWQDEWFKRTWNTMDYNNQERRAYWNDVQTCEQHFGIMEFVSQENLPTPVVDGNAGEWTENELVIDKNGTKVYAKNDSTYLYIMVDSKNADYDSSGNIIYFDITIESGAKNYGEAEFGRKADIILDINGKEETRMMIQADFDVYHVLFKNADKDIVKEFKDCKGGFGHIYLITDREMYLPHTKKTVPVQRVETGLLRFGISDTESKDYDSLADFCYNGDVFEVRIPWQLLGFRDPSRKEIQHISETGELEGHFVDNIYIGMITPKEDLGGAYFTWDNWELAVTKTRLRQSYYIIRDYLATLN